MNEPGIDVVRRIAALARLEVGEAEARELAQKFERILGQFQVLARLDVTGVEEAESPLRPADQRRADLPRPSLALEQVLAQAPARVEGFYRVPKTVGGEE
jgi:aspartyl-tRNA(Asn)/glutamyl-tRNA(Gln) amidotransferase subunit C